MITVQDKREGKAAKRWVLCVQTLLKGRRTTWRCNHPIEHIEETKLDTLRTFERYFGNRDVGEVAANLIKEMRVDLTSFLLYVTFGGNKHAW